MQTITSRQQHRLLHSLSSSLGALQESPQTILETEFYPEQPLVGFESMVVDTLRRYSAPFYTLRCFEEESSEGKKRKKGTLVF